MDIARSEAVEAELDAMIRCRRDQRVAKEGERPAEEMWRESERRYQEQQRLQARYEWHLYHTAQAERHRRTLEELIASHEAAAARLMEANNERKTA